MKTTWITTLSGALFLLLTACGGPSGEAGKDTENIGETGNTDIDVLSQAIAEDPDDPTLYAARARLFYQNEGYDEAIQDLSRALRLDSLNIGYHHLLADVYLDYFKSRLALQTLDRAVAIDPTHIPTLLKLSEFQLILKKYDASMQTIDRILQIDPQNAEAYFMFGMNFKEAGDTTRAINSFQKSVELDPELVDGWINLGQLHAALDNDIAARFFDSALEVAPASLTALHAKADYLSGQDDLEGALAVYREIVRIDPQYDDAYFNSGLLYLDLDSLDRAYDQFNLTLQVSPMHIKGYYFRGLTAEMQGDTAQARADYQQALRLAPDYRRPSIGLQRLETLQ